MDKKIKDYIANQKLTDEEIYKRLTAEPPAADEEQEEDSDKSDVETESHEEDSEDEEDASEEEQPNIAELIKAEVAKTVAKELGKMKRGKKPPKINKKISKKKIIQSDYSQAFGEL